MNKVDILKRLADSSPSESTHELQCRCWDAAEEISKLRAVLEVTRGNIQSIKTSVGVGVITYDVWLDEVDKVLPV